MYNPEQGHRGGTQACRSLAGGTLLLELMLGLAIGLLVVLAAMTSLAHTHHAADTVEENVGLQQTAELVFHTLAQHIHPAGGVVLNSFPGTPGQVIFSNAYTGLDGKAAVPHVARPTSARNVVQRGSSRPKTERTKLHELQGSARPMSLWGGETTAVSSTGTNTTSARLRTSREHNGDGVNCLGQAGEVESIFALEGRQLRCIAAGNQRQTLADNVADFQARYTVRDNTANGPSFRRYSGAEVPDWNNLQALTVCLHLTGERRSQPLLRTGLRDCRNQPITPDGRLHRVLWRTYQLRNALPAP